MIQSIHGVDKFAALAAEWNELYRRARTDNVFLSHGWLLNWLSAFGDKEHVAMLCRRDGKLVAGLVARAADHALHAIEAHTYWSEVLADSEESLGGLLDWCARERRPHIEIHGPERSSYRERLERAARRNFVVLSKNPWLTRGIAVPGDLDAYLAARPAKVRAELRRKLRRFGERAPQATLVRVDTAARAEPIFRAVERDSWKFEAGTAIASSSKDERFYRGLFDLAGESGQAFLFALMAGSAPIAFVLGVQHRRTFFALKTSYDMAWADLSPGIVLFCKLIEQFCRDRTVEAIELLGRESRWKRELGNSEKIYCVYELRSRDVATSLYSMAHNHVRPLWQRVQHARGK